MVVGRWWQPTACVRHCSNLFSFYFSDKIYQIGVLLLKNFHFSLSFFKNGVKRSKNPILHDSPFFLALSSVNPFFPVSSVVLFLALSSVSSVSPFLLTSVSPFSQSFTGTSSDSTPQEWLEDSLGAVHGPDIGHFL